MASMMSRPMSGQVNSQASPNRQYSDPVEEIIAFAQNGGDAEQELRRRMQQNPQVAQEFGRFVQQNRGRNPWELLNELATQRGINLSRYGLGRK